MPQSCVPSLRIPLPGEEWGTRLFLDCSQHTLFSLFGAVPAHRYAGRLFIFLRPSHGACQAQGANNR